LEAGRRGSQNLSYQLLCRRPGNQSECHREEVTLGAGSTDAARHGDCACNKAVRDELSGWTITVTSLLSRLSGSTAQLSSRWCTTAQMPFDV
jgi:hypothetical protein